jgi:hypothetical protein
MAEIPRYLSLPFANSPVLQDGQHVGFTVGVTLTHDGQTVTQAVDVICGPDQAAALTTGPIEAYTAWSRQALIEHDLVARANAAMDAKLGLPVTVS